MNYALSRPASQILIDLAEQGMVDWKNIAIDMMNWVEDDEVMKMLIANGYIDENIF